MALLAAKDVPLRRVMKAFLASGVPTLALVQVLHFAGIIAPNAASERDGSYRLMFGYGHPNTFGGVVLGLLLAWVLLRRARLTWAELGGLAAVGVVLMVAPKSRSSALTHIPDDHYYQEKFYFVPGDTGFQVFDTTYGKIGVGICWDQWFPETARAMAVKGAELLFYPTAIGSEPILECDSMPHWRRAMQGHAAANLMPVIAANRIGTEEVVPCEENGGQRSALTFYGSSFITDQTGELVAEADREKEQVILATFDLHGLPDDGTGLALIAIFGMCHICDNGITAFSFFNKRDTCLDLRKHGTGSKLIFSYVFFRICGGDGAKLLLISFAKVQAYIFYTGENKKCVCIQLFRKKSCCKIFLNNGTGSVKVNSLLKYWDSAAACCDNYLVCI